MSNHLLIKISNQVKKHFDVHEAFKEIDKSTQTL